MKRRIISIISILAVICSLFQVPVLASKTEIDENKLSVLRSLDILGDELPKRVTYDVFVEALMGYVAEGAERELYTPETFAKSVGMISSGEEYDGSAVISLNDAVKYSVILLGYNKTILPDVNYGRVASSENLLKGVSGNDTLKPADMVVFLHNLLSAEPLEVEVLGEKGPIYSASEKHTLISLYRDIYVCNGIITANEFTSIYSENGAGENAISIGNYTFDLDCNYDRGLLGCNVTAYVKDDGDNEPYVIYLHEREKRNNRLIIWDEDIISVDSKYTVVEYEDERGREEKIKLEKHPKVIINGVFYGNYTQADLMPENGYVEFIDNTGDSKYEIINVKSYMTVVVDSVDVTKKVIKGDVEFTEEHQKPINLDNVEYSIEKDGEDIKISDIKEGDVLSVAMSRGAANRVCEIVVSSQRVKFTVSRINTNDNKIYDGRTAYTLSKEYTKYLDSEMKEIRVGGIYEFLMDAFGRIVYAKTMSEDSYALFFRATIDWDDNVYIEYLDVDGKWNKTKLDKKVTVNEITQTAEKTFDVLKVMDPQIVGIKLNSDGYVKQMRTPTEVSFNQAKLIEEGFTKTSEMTYAFRPISNTFENVMYLKSGAKLFVVPKNAIDKHNKEMYYVVDALSYFVEAEFTVTAYNVDRFGYAELLSVKGSNEDRRVQDNVFVVTGIKQVVDQYGDPCMRLEGCGDGYKDISFLTADTEVLNGVNVGDVVNFMLNNSGRVSKVSTPVAKLQDAFTQYNTTQGNYYNLNRISARIAEIDFENGRIIFDYGTDEVTFPFTSTINCMEYNKTTQECDLINYDSFTKNDKVLVITKHYGIRDMIRICE